MRLMWQNMIDVSGVVVTAGSENADLPVSNLIHPHRGKVYRTGVSVAAEWVKFDFGSPKAVRDIIILAHDLQVGDSAIKIQGNATDSWGAPSVDQVVTYNPYVMAHHFPEDQMYQWWRFIFTKGAAAETRDIGRIYLGPSYECERGPAMPGGLKITPDDYSVTDSTPDGVSYSDIRPIRNMVSVRFPPVSDAQMEQLKALASACGTHTPFFVSIAPASKPYDLLYYVKARSLKGRELELAGPGGPRKWQAELELAEDI